MIKLWGSADQGPLAQITSKASKGLSPPLNYGYIDAYEHDGLILPNAGDVVIAMGGYTSKMLSMAGIVPKGRSITSLREQVYPHHIKDPSGNHVGTGHWMVSYSPSVVNTDPKMAGELVWDIRLAHRMYRSGSLEPKLGSYAWTRSLKGFIKYCKDKFEKTGKATDVAVDTETMGLFPWYDKKEIVCFQVSALAGTGLAVHCLDEYWETHPEEWEEFLKDVREILTAPYISVRGANFKYDILWILEKWNIHCTNFKMDTTMVGSLLDENRSNSLGWHSKVHTDMGGYDTAFNKTYDKGKMEKIPPAVLLPYAAGDSDACLQIADEMKKELINDPDTMRLYVKLVHPALRMLEKMEHRGLVVDKKKYGELEQKISKEMHTAHQEALDALPVKLQLKYSDNLSLTRSAIIVDYLFTKNGLNLKPIITTEKSGAPSTAGEHLAMFSDHPEAGPFITNFKKWSKAKKMLSTYVHGFMAHLRPDGRFHPTYMLFNGSMFGGKDDDSGTNTGRLAAKNPAVQTIPKHTFWATPMRKCFPAPDGYTFFDVDFTQGELKITACVAQERNMLKAYKNGVDLHALTGARLSETDFDEFMSYKSMFDPKSETQCQEYLNFKKYRQAAKAANFGLLYGMGATGYQAYAKASYGVVLTDAEAVQQRDAFFELYPDLIKWHNVYKGYAKKYGYVSSPLGRKRHLPLIHSNINEFRAQAERQSVNSPIQSCLSDLCLWSATLLEEKYASEGLWLSGATHDNLYGYFPKDSLIDWPKAIVEVMENLPIEDTFSWKPDLKFTVDFSVGPDMGSLEELEL